MDKNEKYGIVGMYAAATETVFHVLDGLINAMEKLPHIGSRAPDDPSVKLLEAVRSVEGRG